MEDVWLWWLEERRRQEGRWQRALRCGNGEAAPSAPVRGLSCSKEMGASWWQPLTQGWGGWTQAQAPEGHRERLPRGERPGETSIHQGQVGSGWSSLRARLMPRSPGAVSCPSARRAKIGLTAHIGAEGVWSLSGKRPIFVTAGKTAKRQTRKKKKRGNNSFFINLFISSLNNKNSRNRPL